MSRRVFSALFLGICVFTLSPAFARGGDIVSNFNTGAEGWQVVSFENLTTDNFSILATHAPTFNVAGGNPGGYISTTDQDSGDFVFSAPAKFLGNVAGATGLSYDLIYPVGAINYQPTSDYSGADSFQYTVRDNFGALSNAATVSVTVQPAPVATNDTATLQANSSVTIAVLANDTSSGGTLDPTSIKIVVATIHGTAAVSGGQVTYTPATGYTGLDTFQYTVQDNLGTTSNVATVSVNVTAPPGKGGGGSLSLLGILALAGLALWDGVFRSERRAKVINPDSAASGL